MVFPAPEPRAAPAAVAAVAAALLEALGAQEVMRTKILTLRVPQVLVANGVPVAVALLLTSTLLPINSTPPVLVLLGLLSLLVNSIRRLPVLQRKEVHYGL